jgi:hypothetical protein
VQLLVFHPYINKMQGSRSKIPSKNLVRQRCAEGFNSSVKGLKVYLRPENSIVKLNLRGSALSRRDVFVCYEELDCC